jgi:hypothetical protein
MTESNNCITSRGASRKYSISATLLQSQSLQASFTLSNKQGTIVSQKSDQERKKADVGIYTNQLNTGIPVSWLDR